jgi:hypothetical protein
MRYCAWLIYLVMLTGMTGQAFAAIDCVVMGKNPSYIIELKPNKNVQSLIHQQLLNVQNIRNLTGGRYLLFPRPSTVKAVKPACYSPESVEDFRQVLLNQPYIQDAMPNSLMDVYALSPVQWNLLSPPGGINVEPAWKNFKHTGKVSVAILDTGVYNNNSLNKNLLYASWNGQAYEWQQGPNNAEEAGISFVDNGQVWAVGASPICKTCKASSHGTHVAGIVVASGDLAYGEQIYGVAPTSTVLPINIFSRIDDEDICDGAQNTPCMRAYIADQLNAENWLAGYPFPNLPQAPKVSVVNLSLGGMGACSPILQQHFQRLIQKNMSVVVAAGNANLDVISSMPANCPQVITVASTGPAGEKAWYSNWGDLVDIAAPGGNSKSNYMSTPYNQIYSSVANAYQYFQGTSMSSPMVAGVIALMYSLDKGLNRDKALSLITNEKYLTPFPLNDDVQSVEQKHNYGKGIINAGKIIAFMLQAPSIIQVKKQSANLFYIDYTDFSEPETHYLLQDEQGHQLPITLDRKQHHFVLEGDLSNWGKTVKIAYELDGEHILSQGFALNVVE